MLSEPRLKHVRKVVLNDLNSPNSYTSGLFDVLHRYSLAVPLLQKPGETHLFRKSRKSEILRYCQRYHVCEVNGAGADSVYYVRNKSYGIPSYVFEKSVHKVVFLMMWRTGAWRKVEGLRQFFLSPNGRPMCTTCAAEMNGEHLLEHCVRFEEARAAAKDGAGLRRDAKVSEMFDKNPAATPLLVFCKVLTDFVHHVSGCADSELMRRCVRANFCYVKNP